MSTKRHLTSSSSAAHSREEENAYQYRSGNKKSFGTNKWKRPLLDTILLTLLRVKMFSFQWDCHSNKRIAQGFTISSQTSSNIKPSKETLFKTKPKLGKQWRCLAITHLEYKASLNEFRL
eukprot:4893438-Amphidinium_carterae.1